MELGVMEKGAGDEQVHDREGTPAGGERRRIHQSAEDKTGAWDAVMERSMSIREGCRSFATTEIKCTQSRMWLRG